MKTASVLKSLNLWCLLFLSGFLFTSAALGSDPVVSGSLSNTPPGALDWTVSASDGDGDLVALDAFIRIYPTEADCIADINLFKVVQVANFDHAAGVASHSESGTLNAREGTWCKLVVEATDAIAGTGTTTTLHYKVSADPYDRKIIAGGDVIPGVGTVTLIRNMAVDNYGNTMITVETDNPDLDTNDAALRNGHLVLTEGQALPLPAGASLGTFDTPNLNSSLNSAWFFELDGMALTEDKAIYLNTNLLLQEGFPSTAPTFAPHNFIYWIWECKINESNNILAIMSVTDPWVPLDIDWAMILMTVDGSGNLASETVVLREGWTIPGQPYHFTGAEIRAQTFALNDLDHYMFVAHEAWWSSDMDQAVYINHTLLAREGHASPIPGRNWKSLAGAEVDLNNVGGWVIHGELEGDADTDFLIEKSGDKLVQEGDLAPNMNGYVFTRFGMGPVAIGDTDNALWFGDWNDPDKTRDTGLFLNDHLIVQEGVTLVDGAPLGIVMGIEYGYVMSPNGHWVLYEADLANGEDVAVLLHIGPWTFLGQGLEGTGGKTPALQGKGSLEAGSEMRLELTNAMPNSVAALVVGMNDLSVPVNGGMLVPSPDLLFMGLPVDNQGEMNFGGQVPPGIASDTPIWFQCWIVDPATPAGYSASNAVKCMTP